MKFLFFIINLLAITACSDDSPKFNHRMPDCPVLSVRFSPSGGVTQSIVDGIDSADATVRVLAFSFTSPPIGDALVSAKKHGKQVEIVLDRENLGNPNSIFKKLYANHIPIYIDDKHAIAHNKVIIIDATRVFTGSANFTIAGDERNAENSISILDLKTTSLYQENWELHKNHSYLYSGDE